MAALRVRPDWRHRGGPADAGAAVAGPDAGAAAAKRWVADVRRSWSAGGVGRGRGPNAGPMPRGWLLPSVGRPPASCHGVALRRRRELAKLALFMLESEQLWHDEAPGLGVLSQRACGEWYRGRAAAQARFGGRRGEGESKTRGRWLRIWPRSPHCATGRWGQGHKLGSRATVAGPWRPHSVVAQVTARALPPRGGRHSRASRGAVRREDCATERRRTCEPRLEQTLRQLRGLGHLH